MFFSGLASININLLFFSFFPSGKDAFIRNKESEEAADGVGAERDPRRGREEEEGEGELPHHFRAPPQPGRKRAESLPRHVRGARRVR